MGQLIHFWNLMYVYLIDLFVNQIDLLHKHFRFRFFFCVVVGGQLHDIVQIQFNFDQ